MRFESIYFGEVGSGRILDLFMGDGRRGVGVFFVHGGGWRSGKRDIFHRIMWELLKDGYDCCSVDYSLGGDIFGQLEDIRLGYGVFLDELSKLGRGGEKIVVYGSSAGAHLASLLVLAEPGECGEALCEGVTHKRADGMVLSSAPGTFELWDNIFPPIAASMEDIVGAKYSEHPEIFKKLSPIEYVNEKSPPVLQMYSENEHMFPLRFLECFREKMVSLKRWCKIITYPDAEHGFFYDVTRNCQKMALKDFKNFLEKEI